ncbi:MAG: tetratricopeptide repeat protein [Spirochaetales bacterium]|nr:tetratricopeptide repeat protein [Spirochaetales bacterium]
MSVKNAFFVILLATASFAQESTYNRALELYSQSKYSESLELLRSAFNQESYEERLLAAMNYVKLGDGSSALAHLSVLDKKSPGKPEVAILLAAAHRILMRLPAAEQVLIRSITLHPNHADLRHELARIYYDTRRYEAARQQIARILTLSPSHQGAIYLDGLIYMREGNYENAEFRFNHMIQLGQMAPALAADVLNNLGYCYEQRGLKAEGGDRLEFVRKALDHYDQALRAVPGHGPATANKARLKLQP